MSKHTLALLLGCCILTSLLTVFVAKWLVFDPRVEELAQEAEYRRLRTFASTTPTSFTDAAESVRPAVVAVRSYHKRRNASGINVESSTGGSGVIISPGGYIVTNNHVVEGAGRIRVTLGDRREYDAKVVGVDESTDLALLSIRANNLPHLTFGNSDSLRVGEWVMAVGNPFNLKSTVTAGIVSAKGRSIDVLRPDDRIESFIQTDASVNPGNSGGALINTNGELVGINTAIVTGSGRHEGFAFAIPGNLANRVVNDLRRFGKVERAVLGVYIQGINDAQAKRLRLSAARGAIVTSLVEGGPAESAGLRVGDVLTALNGVAINSSPELQEQLSRYRPGDKITLTFIRNRVDRRTVVRLRQKAIRGKMLVSESSDDLLHRLGFEVRLNTDDRIEVISVFRDSPIARTNMNPGFQITDINGVWLDNLTDFLAILRSEREILFGGEYDGVEGRYYYRIER